MNRIKYQYQILRYMPDLVSGEFVNVGVVVYQPENRFLKAATINRYARITQFFEEINGNYLLQTVKHIRNAVNQRGRQMQSEVPFELPGTIDAITKEVLPKDDSALFFTEASTGVDINMNAAFEKLQKRYIQDQAGREHTASDKEVWQKVYKPFFDKHGLSSRLHKKTIVTPTENIDFDLAYKNGHWNCLESANFDLKAEDSIKGKVWKIIGKLDALSESDEELEYHILAQLKPSDPKMGKYIKDKLEGHKMGNARINLVTKTEAASFVKRVKSDLESH